MFRVGIRRRTNAISNLTLPPRAACILYAIPQVDHLCHTNVAKNLEKADMSASSVVKISILTTTPTRSLPAGGATTANSGKCNPHIISPFSHPLVNGAPCRTKRTHAFCGAPDQSKHHPHVVRAAMRNGYDRMPRPEPRSGRIMAAKIAALLPTPPAIKEEPRPPPTHKEYLSR